MSLQEAINKERERLNARLTELADKKAELDKEIATVNAELKAITAYETVRTGKVKEKTERTKRPRETGLKANILELLKKHPHGLGRAGVIDGLGLRGDKGKEQTVSNTLANMKKKDEIKLNDGIYSV